MDIQLKNATTAPHLDRYRIHLAHLNMPTERQTALLLALEHILASFVDRAFGDDPVQHVHESVARDEKTIPPVVKSEESNPKQDDTRRSSATLLSAADGRTEDS